MSHLLRTILGNVALVQLGNRLRKIDSSFAWSHMHDANENREERMAAQNPGVEMHLKGALLSRRISGDHFFLIVFLQLRLMKDRLLEV